MIESWKSNSTKCGMFSLNLFRFGYGCRGSKGVTLASYLGEIVTVLITFPTYISHPGSFLFGVDEF